jgi:hypothetical protein
LLEAGRQLTTPNGGLLTWIRESTSSIEVLLGMSWICAPSELRSAFLRQLKCEHVTHQKVPPNFLCRFQRVLERFQSSCRLEQAESVRALLVEESRRRGWVTGGGVVCAFVGIGPPRGVGGGKVARCKGRCGGASGGGQTGCARVCCGSVSCRPELHRTA